MIGCSISSPTGRSLITQVPVLLENEGMLTGEILSDAWKAPGDYGLPVVMFRLTPEGSKKFGRLTGANVGRDLANRKSTRLNSSHMSESRMPSSA